VEFALLEAKKRKRKVLWWTGQRGSHLEKRDRCAAARATCELVQCGHIGTRAKSAATRASQVLTSGKSVNSLADEGTDRRQPYRRRQEKKAALPTKAKSKANPIDSGRE
jgi:hypothetical protein